MEIAGLHMVDIPEIISLARITWQHTYRSIISQEQIDYMLNRFYAPTLIEEQMNDPAHFFFGVKDGDTLLGYSHSFLQEDRIKLSKLYVSPLKQSIGCGRQLLQQLEEFSKEKNIHQLELNVNRHNPAKDFYLKMGFTIERAVDIPLDKFWLNDYIMIKQLSNEA